MKKYFIIICMVIFNYHFTQSQKLIGEIKIENHTKNITNLSGVFKDSISFHILLNKDKKTKKYFSEVYFFDSKGIVKKIHINSQKKKPTYVAFHVNDEVLTLVKKEKEKTIVQDINYKSETINSVEINVGIQSIFSQKAITLLILGKNENQLDFAFVKSSKDIERYIYDLTNGAEKSIISNFNSKNTDFVDNDNFIDKGFIKKVRGFYKAPSVFLIKDSKKRKAVNLLEIKPGFKMVSKKIILKNENRIKKLNSFIVDNLIFVFCMESKKAKLLIYDLVTLDLKKTFDYNLNDFGKFNKVVKNGKDVTKSFKPKSFFKSYFPQAVGSTYNAELYIGVNKTNKNGYLVQVGHVDKNKFKNLNSGNYWWGYPAFSLNYNFNDNNIIGNANIAALFFDALSENKRKGNFFELNLDDNLNHSQNSATIKYKNFQEDKYVKRLQKLYKLKRYYLIPFYKKFRLINFNKDTNSYQLHDFNQS